MKNHKIVELEFNNLYIVACQLNDTSEDYYSKTPWYTIF